MIVGGYTLDLYCRHEMAEHPHDYFPHQFYGRNFTDVKKQAKAKGWVFHADRNVTCPLCSKRKPKP